MAQIVDLDRAALEIPNDALIGLAAGCSPVALLRALIRGGARGLRVVTAPAAGFDVDLLIGAGCVQAVETSGINLGEHGLAPNFDRAVREGTLRVRDSSCPVLLAAIQAGVSGVPFTPVPGLLGSDLLRVRPDFLVIPNPFSLDQKVVVVPAVRPDVALLHALRAEPGGAAVFSAHGDAVMLAQASRRVIVTAEEIYEGATAVLSPDDRLLGGIYVDVLVSAPHGCWPIGLRGRYGADELTLAAYLQAARTQETFTAYVQSLCEPEAAMVIAP